jgi:hypothetical protein
VKLGLILRERHSWRLAENKVLVRLFGLEKQEVTTTENCMATSAIISVCLRANKFSRKTNSV